MYVDFSRDLSVLSRYALSGNVLELIVREKRCAKTKPMLKVYKNERSYILSVFVLLVSYVFSVC